MREEHRIARAAAAGTAGAVVIGAAFGLTGAALSNSNNPGPPEGASLDVALEDRDGQAPSRGLARATTPESELPGRTVPRAAAPSASPAPTTQAPDPEPPPPAPEDCEEYSGNRQIGCTLLLEFGFGLDQMESLDSLWTHESGWDHTAHNPSSGAYGIPQALPGSKMATAGDDWETNPATQIRWGLGYIQDRYGSPNEAWAFFQSNGWY